MLFFPLLWTCRFLAASIASTQGDNLQHKLFTIQTFRTNFCDWMHNNCTYNDQEELKNLSFLFSFRKKNLVIIWGQSQHFFAVAAEKETMEWSKCFLRRRRSRKIPIDPQQRKQSKPLFMFVFWFCSALLQFLPRSSSVSRSADNRLWIIEKFTWFYACDCIKNNKYNKKIIFHRNLYDANLRFMTVIYFIRVRAMV